HVLRVMEGPDAIVAPPSYSGTGGLQYGQVDGGVNRPASRSSIDAPRKWATRNAMLALTGVRPYTMSVTVFLANRSTFTTTIQSPTRAWVCRIAARTRCCSSVLRSEAFCGFRAIVMAARPPCAIRRKLDPELVDPQRIDALPDRREGPGAM